MRITPGTPFITQFIPREAGTLSEVDLPRVKDDLGLHEVITMTLSIASATNPEAPVATGSLVEDFTPVGDPRGDAYKLQLDHPLQLDPQQSYSLKLEVASPSALPLAAEAQAVIEPVNGEPIIQQLNTPIDAIYPNAPLWYEFQADENGLLTQLRLTPVPGSEASLAAGEALPDAFALTLQPVSGNDLTATGEPLLSELALQGTTPEGGLLLNLISPVQVSQGETYRLTLRMRPSGGALALSGLGVANEGEWDDGLPLRMDGYDGFGGIYPTDLNFNMYWDDIPEKLERFLRILDESDYIVISSNRQWGTLPRIPERFPMTTQYYRSLMGCPDELDIVDCYRVAEPGMFQGALGYELEKVFTSEPRLGPLRLNDQFAEEAFTVYDHPKVLIFKKTSGYNPQQARDILSAIDLSQVIRVPPLRAPSHPSTLLLPEERLSEQQAGGTWSELFNLNALQNRYPLVSILLWYLSVGFLGLITYPLLRLAVPGLNDRGYPLARIAGMLLLSYLAWLAGSARIPFSRTTIAVLLLALTFAGCVSWVPPACRAVRRAS